MTEPAVTAVRTVSEDDDHRTVRVATAEEVLAAIAPLPVVTSNDPTLSVASVTVPAPLTNVMDDFIASAAARSRTRMLPRSNPCINLSRYRVRSS